MQGTGDSMLARQKEAIIMDLGDSLTKVGKQKKPRFVEVGVEGGYTRH